MKKLTALLAGSAALASVALSAPAQAASFNIGCTGSDADCNGESGTLSITYDGSSLYTVEIDNMATNDATITGFGFDFGDAFDFSEIQVASFTASVGGSDVSADWSISDGNQNVSAGTSYSGISLDFINFDAKSQGQQGSIANSGGLDATFTFTSTQDFLANAGGGLLRFQSSGIDGEGSLKLVCTDSDGCVSEKVPEPVSGLVSLLGLSVAGLLKKRLA